MTAHKLVWLRCDPCSDEVDARDDDYDDAEIFGGEGDHFETAAEARRHAREDGWLYVKGRDICPAHNDAGAR